MNCYLALGESDAVLVDTGLPVAEHEIVANLCELLEHRRLSVFPTRPVEFDSIGNIGAILQAGARRVWSDMPMNGLAGWQARYEPPPLGTDASWPLDSGVEFLPFPAELEVGERRLEVIQPELRMLMTAWLYDPASGTLFTSDMFSHVLAPAPGSWFLDGPDGTTVGQVAAHHAAKHHWLEGADGAKLAAWLEALLAERRVQTIAPTFGCVLSGRETVERHAELMLAALRRFRKQG